MGNIGTWHSGNTSDPRSTKDAEALAKYLNPRVETKAASFSVTAADSGKTYYVTAADKVATLPSVADGLTYTFSVNTLGGSTGFSIAPAAADFIQFVNLTDNTAVVNTAATDVIGDGMTVVGDATLGGWIVTSVIGIWASA